MCRQKLQLAQQAIPATADAVDTVYRSFEAVDLGQTGSYAESDGTRDGIDVEAITRKHEAQAAIQMVTAGTEKGRLCFVIFSNKHSAYSFPVTALMFSYPSLTASTKRRRSGRQPTLCLPTSPGTSRMRWPRNNL